MRKEDWNRGLGEIDPELIEDFLEQKAEHVRRGRGRSYLQWIAVAACVCLVIAATVVIPIALRYGNDRVLEIPDESTVSESMEETGDITSKDHNSQQGDDISSDRMSYSKVYDESDYPDIDRKSVV